MDLSKFFSVLPYLLPVQLYVDDYEDLFEKNTPYWSKKLGITPGQFLEQKCQVTTDLLRTILLSSQVWVEDPLTSLLQNGVVSFTYHLTETIGHESVIFRVDQKYLLIESYSGQYCLKRTLFTEAEVENYFRTWAAYLESEDPDLYETVTGVRIPRAVFEEPYLEFWTTREPIPNGVELEEYLWRRIDLLLSNFREKLANWERKWSDYHEYLFTSRWIPTTAAKVLEECPPEFPESAECYSDYLRNRFHI